MNNELFLKVDEVEPSFIGYRFSKNVGFKFPEVKYNKLAMLIKKLKFSGDEKYKNIAFSDLFRSAINYLNDIFENGYVSGSNAEKHLDLINNFKIIDQPLIRRAVNLDKAIYENLTLFKIFRDDFIDRFLNTFLDFYIKEISLILENVNNSIEVQTENNNIQTDKIFNEEDTIQEEVNKKIDLIDEAIRSKINQVIKDRINNAFSNKEFINNIISAELEKLKI